MSNQKTLLAQWFVYVMTISLMAFFCKTLKAEDLSGTFAFDWHHVKTSNCKKMEFAQLKKSKKWKCGVTDVNFGGDDKPPFQSCKSKDEKKEVLFYHSLADCRLARNTELANGN